MPQFKGHITVITVAKKKKRKKKRKKRKRKMKKKRKMKMKKKMKKKKTLFTRKLDLNLSTKLAEHYFWSIDLCGVETGQFGNR